MGKQQGKKKQAKTQKKWLFYLTAILLLVLLCLMGVLMWKIISLEHEKVVEVSPPLARQSVVPTAPIAVKPLHKEHQLEVHEKKIKIVLEKKEAVKVTFKPEVTSGVALIIDDMGYDVHALKRLLALSIPLAISVLPNAPHAVEVARMTHKAGQLVMLHLPMEPVGEYYRNRMDASFLKVGIGEQAVRAVILQDLAKIPYVQGINNHMGSRLTSMVEPMTWVMQVCREKSLFFVDSKTSSKSLAATVAKQYGLAWGTREIFLDDSVQPKAMKKAWKTLELCVRRKKRCIVIAHPHKQTLALLEDKLPILKQWQIYPLKLLLHQPQ